MSVGSFLCVSCYMFLQNMQQSKKKIFFHIIKSSNRQKEAFLYMKRQVVNPFLPDWEYVPDAEPHVFGDRVGFKYFDFKLVIPIKKWYYVSWRVSAY